MISTAATLRGPTLGSRNGPGGRPTIDYPDAGSSPDVPADDAPQPSARSQRGLDWLNFFVADVQTGFGPFIAVYLAAQGWRQGDVGLILTTGSVVGILSQMPGGALVDAVRHKRALVAASLALVAAGAVLFFASPNFLVILLAQILHGSTAGVIAPALTAIGLGLVGHRGLSRRLGRNHRYDSIGNAGTAAMMGLLGHFVAKRASFLFAAALCLPAVWALGRIRGDEIDYARARAAKASATGPDEAARPGRYRDLLRNRRLLAFGLVLLLFQMANASVMPLISERLGRQGNGASELIVSALVIVPQLITASLAGWVAGLADGWGRKPLLLIAFAALVLRIGLFSVAPSAWYLVPMQSLGGIDAVVIGILTPLVIADVTRGSGRYNLAQGAVGMTIGIAAALSTTVSGFVSQRYGFFAGFAGLTMVAALGLLAVWLLLPETRPEDATA